MIATPLILAFICSIMSGVAQIFFKKGTTKLKFEIKSLIKNYNLILGFVTYGISAIIFIVALRFGNLSVLYPINALAYVWVSILALKFLNEKMNIYKWMGVILILMGVIFTSVI